MHYMYQLTQGASDPSPILSFSINIDRYLGSLEPPLEAKVRNQVAESLNEALHEVSQDVVLGGHHWSRLFSHGNLF